MQRLGDGNRTFHTMKTLLLTSLVLLFANTLSAQETKPNIVYIIADDLGYGDLSCYGQKGFQTPNLDKMASDGLKFTSHYAGNTVCAPSRSSLMTGQDAGHTYIRGNGEHQLREKDVTIAELLKEAGYKTGMIGKSCVTGNVFDAKAPHNHGFDYFWGTLSHKTAHFHYPKQIFSQGEAIKIEGNSVTSGNVYIQDEYTKRSLEFIEYVKDDPFFLLLSFSVPHASLQAPQEAIDPFVGKFDDEKSYKGGHYTAVKHVKASYAAMTTRLDQHVGEVVAKLKELGLEENTLICFTSDNGSHLEGGYHYSLFNSNGELRGGKRDLYEGGIRVPFIVKWPKVIQAGRTTDHPSAFWDFLPTACEMAGAEAPENIQGISFLPLLKGENQPRHPYMYWEYTAKGGRVALRKDDWKIVRYDIEKPNKKTNATSSYELYNLTQDIGEKNDLASQHPEKLAELLKLLKSAREPSPVQQWNFKNKF